MGGENLFIDSVYLIQEWVIIEQKGGVYVQGTMIQHFFDSWLNG